MSLILVPRTLQGSCSCCFLSTLIFSAAIMNIPSQIRAKRFFHCKSIEFTNLQQIFRLWKIQSYHPIFYYWSLLVDTCDNTWIWLISCFIHDQIFSIWNRKKYYLLQTNIIKITTILSGSMALSEGFSHQSSPVRCDLNVYLAFYLFQYLAFVDGHFISADAEDTKRNWIWITHRLPKSKKLICLFNGANGFQKKISLPWKSWCILNSGISHFFWA